jgi:hypothetical protein
MPNNDEKGTLDARALGGMINKTFHKLKWSGCLSQAFIFMASLVALVAIMALILWSLVTFIVPFQLFNRSEQYLMNNGQVLQVSYPNLILAGDTPTYITLVIHGKPIGPLPVFDIEVPAGLTVVEPFEQANSGRLKLPTSGSVSSTEPEEIKIGVINAQTELGSGLQLRAPQISLLEILFTCETR